MSFSYVPGLTQPHLPLSAIYHPSVSRIGSGSANPVLHAVIEPTPANCLLTADALYTVFARFGHVLRIQMFSDENALQALVEMGNTQAATVAKQFLGGGAFNGVCAMRVFYTNMCTLNIIPDGGVYANDYTIWSADTAVFTLCSSASASPGSDAASASAESLPAAAGCQQEPHKATQTQHRKRESVAARLTRSTKRLREAQPQQMQPVPAVQQQYPFPTQHELEHILADFFGI